MHEHLIVFSSETRVQGLCTLPQNDVGRGAATCAKQSGNSCRLWPDLRLAGS